MCHVDTSLSHCANWVLVKATMNTCVHMLCSGCDRHLMGLQIVAFEEGIDKPELFSDPSWVKRCCVYLILL